MPLRLWNTRTAKTFHRFDATADYYDVSGDAWEPVQPPATRTSKGAGDVRPFPFGCQAVCVGRFAPATRELIPKIATLDAEGRQWLDGLVDRPARSPLINSHSGTSPGESPSGRYVVAGRRSPKLVYGPLLGLDIQSRDGQRVSTLDIDGWNPAAWNFNSDENRLLVAYHGKTAERPLILWDLAKGERLRTVPAIREEHPEWKITALTLSPNDRYGRGHDRERIQDPPR